MKQKLLHLTLAFLFLVLNVTSGQTMPELGATSGFALFTAGGAFNEFGTSSTVTGDVSTNAGAFAAFPPGTLNGNKFLPGSAVAVQAATDVALAYSSLNQGGAVISTVLDGLTLTPGVYTTGAASSLSADGVLTLNGQGNPEAIFIIRIGGALATGSNSTILLTNSASLSKIFWQIGGQFDLGINSIFRGTVIASGAINLLESSTLYGRGLTTAGAISLHNNIVTLPSHFRSRVSGNWNANGTWESSPDSTSWANAIEIPTLNAVSTNISIGHTVTITGNSTASTLSINPGAKLTLNSTQTLSANIININSDATNGIGTYVSNGTTNAPTANIKQRLTPGRNWYISSPVTAVSVSSINNATGTYLAGYDEVHGSTAPWLTENSTLTPLKGYVAISPVTLNPMLTITGVLNNGTQTIHLSRTPGQYKEGFNLVGNPYPSHLAWTKTIAQNANALSTIWYRTVAGSEYVFQTYNANGEIGVPVEVTGIIPPIQSFWVRVNIGGGTLTLDNSMRLHDGSSNRLKVPAKVTNNQIVRLEVSNGINSDETVLYFNNNALEGFDNFDSPKMSNNNINIPEIYTMVGSEKVVINGLQKISIDRELPLGFVTLSTDNFTIRANELSNIPADIKLILLDKLENVETNLTSGNAYTFSSSAANTVDRFSLIFGSAGSITGNNAANLNQNTLIFTNSANRITVLYKDDLKNNPNVTVYNSTGQEVANQQITNNKSIINQPLKSGLYLVKVNCGAQSITRKVIQ
ncbi:MAG: ice-binding family protein [Paludibacter sp.]